SLYQSDGTTPVHDKNVNPMILSTTKNAVSRFSNLPYGTYVLKETEAPNHYSVPAQNAWLVRLCYTDAWNLQTADISPYEHNMRYKGNDTNGQWHITNSRIPFHYALKVIKVDEAGKPLAEAGFSIVNPEQAGQMLTGETSEDGTYLFNAQFVPNIAYELSEVSPPGGYFSLPAGIQFRVNEDTSNDTYTAVFLNSEDFSGDVSLNLREIGSGSNTQYVLEITVKNLGVYELPATGGSGTLIYTLGGIIFLSVTLIIGLALRRRGEKKSVR
ncbi:MAG: LPXTG cell wall anchor domain-containing protein, partial [Lachnospiraceae bacterium]|nr:LPXTG cell wall anchor domain-containing protein [Lachnospiraceae bacterium]